MFYANPPKVNKIKVNQMLKVGLPEDDVVDALRSLHRAEIDVNTLAELQGDPLSDLVGLVNSPQAKQDQHSFASTIMGYLRGHQEEETIEFGDQSENPSIFMHVPVDERLTSRYFDVEIATLLPSILTKEKLYEVVKRLNILSGKSETVAKQESIKIINELETQTTYANCMPKRSNKLIQEIRDIIGH